MVKPGIGDTIVHTEILSYQLDKRTCTSASSPNAEQLNVGVVPRKPESVTSSTVSPILSTRVALTNDTMM